MCFHIYYVIWFFGTIYKVGKAGIIFPIWQVKKWKTTEGLHGLLKVIQLAKLGPEPKSPDSWSSSQLKNTVLFWPREHRSRIDFSQYGQLFAFWVWNLSLEEDWAEPTALVPGSIYWGTGGIYQAVGKYSVVKMKEALYLSLYSEWGRNISIYPRPPTTGKSVRHCTLLSD